MEGWQLAAGETKASPAAIQVEWEHPLERPNCRPATNNRQCSAAPPWRREILADSLDSIESMGENDETG